MGKPSAVINVFQFSLMFFDGMIISLVAIMSKSNYGLNSVLTTYQVRPLCLREAILIIFHGS